eukprot:2700252-Amphidinium_carterae.1
MYSGNRRILIQGAVSGAVQSTCGLPPGCGLAVDLLHAFLIRTLQSAGRHVEWMIWSWLLPDLTLPTTCEIATKTCLKLKQASMQVNPKKAVVICNGTHTKNKLKRAWRSGLLPPVKITTRDLGVDTQWSCWRSPVQRKRIRTFAQSM